jgi:hypothetical protein
LTPDQDSPERVALLQGLRDTPVPAQVVPFVRRDLGGVPIAHCRIAVLTHRAHDEARRRVAVRMIADDVTPERLGGIAWEALYQDAVARELMCEAITGCKPIEGSGDVFPRLFFTGDELCDHLSPAETQALLDLYAEVQASAYPPTDDDDLEDVDSPPEEARPDGNAAH